MWRKSVRLFSHRVYVRVCVCVSLSENISKACVKPHYFARTENRIIRSSNLPMLNMFGGSLNKAWLALLHNTHITFQIQFGQGSLRLYRSAVHIQYGRNGKLLRDKSQSGIAVAMVLCWADGCPRISTVNGRRTVNRKSFDHRLWSCHLQRDSKHNRQFDSITSAVKRRRSISLIDFNHISICVYWPCKRLIPASIFMILLDFL